MILQSKSENDSVEERKGAGFLELLPVADLTAEPNI